MDVSNLREALPDVDANINVHVEVCQNSISVASRLHIETHAKEFLLNQATRISDDVMFLEFPTDSFLAANVEYIYVSEIIQVPFQHENEAVGGECNFIFYVFQLNTDDPGNEQLDEAEEGTAAIHWILPNKAFDGLWQTLIYDVSIKASLLSYVSAMLIFSEKHIDPNIISWNRVVLLHGPPGTGKTTLCKALAQKLVVRLSHRYQYGQLIEINSHSLFSKWFSESGKLVLNMFHKIQELLENPSSLVVILIDEVESLAAARTASMSGSDPSDAIRVVNALLTQLDSLKKYSNVLILTTSNVTRAIDIALVDRADIKQYIGLPSPPARFSILKSCITELMNKKIIYPQTCLMDIKALEFARFKPNEYNCHSLQLWEIVLQCEGLSGRTLRKLPLLAYARLCCRNEEVTMESYLTALKVAVENKLSENAEIGSGDIQPSVL